MPLEAGPIIISSVSRLLTKFTYSPEGGLMEKDPAMKSYYVCRCPLFKEALPVGEPGTPMVLRYCNACLGKTRYDIVFGVDVEVKVLESVFSNLLQVQAQDQGP
jgi:hypothetical protein